MKRVKGLDYLQRQQLYHQFWEVFNAIDVEECYERYFQFLRKWSPLSPEIQKLFSRYEDNLFHYYNFSLSYRHRLRTVNLAEGFFKHLSELIRRYPGWINEKQVHIIMGLFLKGIKVYRTKFGKINYLTNGGTFVYA